ncbi:unnamed protein product [Ectocarpus sp. 12 AP-2014]
MMTPNGLSPRVTKGQHRRSRSATNKEEIFSASGGGGSSNTKSATPAPSASHGRFFHDPAAAGAAVAPTRPAPSTLPSDSAASPPSPSCNKGHPKQQKKQSSTAIRLVAMMAAASAVLLCTRAATAAASPGGGVRAAAAAGEEAQQNRCAERIERRRGLGVPPDREQCAGVLPDSFMMQHGGGGGEDGRDSESWLVSVHVDRAPSSVDLSKRLRGAAPLHRSLPHQYYVRAMEASLHSIAVAEPGAHVDVAIFSEGQWGGMVDEMGLPLYWDVAGETCDDLGLHCTQHVVLLNERTSPESSQSLDCIAASDLFIASESKFSRAGAVLSDHVKVLTDRWEVDEEEMMVALNPATTIAGMPDSQRQLLRTLVADYHECSASSSY